MKFINITKIIILPVILLAIVFLPLSPTAVLAATSVDLSQITDTSYQEKDALIDGDLLAYTNLGSVNSIDIWGIDLNTKTNFPIVEKPGHQFLTGLHNRFLVYQDFDESSQTYDIRLFNLKTKQDTLVTPGIGNSTGGVTNGQEVVYVDNYACGQIKSYDIDKRTTKILANYGCIPQISDENVVWYSGGIYGYNLRTNRPFNVTIASTAQSPKIFKDTVIWEQSSEGISSVYTKNIKTKNIRLLNQSADYSMTWPSISAKYAVWGKNTAPHITGVEGINLKTGEIFEIVPQGSHQNSNLDTNIWRNIAVFQLWRTGNGDIYTATLNK